MSSLPASGAVVTERVAELVLQHWKNSDCFKQTGEARVPKKGQGKRDDPRWIFSGPRGPANLHCLEEAVGSSKVDDLISDVLP